MPCLSCVDKLAYKLMSHHKIDMIRAYELAEKGMERYEANLPIPPQETQETIIFSGGSDYSQTCNNCAKSCNCDAVPSCTLASQCRDLATCVGLSCCPSPLAHSHQVSNGCTDVTCTYYCKCTANECDGSANCLPHGTCSYDCDVGYVWNPGTLQCEVPVTTKILLKQVGVGL